MKKDYYSKECPSGGSFDNINKENKLSESSYPKKFHDPQMVSDIINYLTVI